MILELAESPLFAQLCCLSSVFLFLCCNSHCPLFPVPSSLGSPPTYPHLPVTQMRTLNECVCFKQCVSWFICVFKG